MGKTTDAKRRDSKNRILRVGESQRADGRYEFKYTTTYGKRKTIYSWRLTPSDPYPSGKKRTLSLREMEAKVVYDLNESNMTISGLLEYALKFNKTLKPKSIDAYESSINFFNKKSSYRDTPLTKVTKSIGRNIFLELTEEYDYKFNTLEILRIFMMKAFNLAIDNDWLKFNPFKFRLGDLICDRQKAITPLSLEDERRLLNFLKVDEIMTPYYNGIYTMLHTGVRVSELCGLTIEDIDFQNKTISINKQRLRANSGEIYIAPPKTKHGIRTIPVNDEILSVLQNEISSHRKKVISKKDFVFLSPTNGQPLIGIYWNGHFNTILKRFNQAYPDNPLPHITPHVLRHTFCTNMANAGMLPKHLQTIMGHGSIKITMDYYTHLNDKQVQDEYERIMRAMA